MICQLWMFLLTQCLYEKLKQQKIIMFVWKNFIYLPNVLSNSRFQHKKIIISISYMGDQIIFPFHTQNTWKRTLDISFLEGQFWIDFGRNWKPCNWKRTKFCFSVFLFSKKTTQAATPWCIISFPINDQSSPPTI